MKKKRAKYKKWGRLFKALPYGLEDVLKEERRGAQGSKFIGVFAGGRVSMAGNGTHCYRVSRRGRS